MRALIPISLGIGLALPTPAHADVGVGVGVGVVVTGEASLQPQFASQFERWLQGHGHQVASSVLPAEAITRMVDCFVIEDADCARKVFEQAGTSRSLVFVKLDPDAEAETERTIVVTAHWFDKGRDGIAERRSCAPCTTAMLETTVDELLTALVRTAAPDRAATGAGELAPGAGATTSATGSSRTLPLALVAGGVGGVVLGAVLYATSETDDGTQFEYRDTRPLGLGIGLAGVAAAGVGTYLYLRKPSRGVPSVAILPGGAYLGWSRAF